MSSRYAASRSIGWPSAMRCASRILTVASSVASGAVLFGLASSASAQILPDTPWGAPASPAEAGISMRAQIDVMFQRSEGGPVVLMRNAFDTTGANVSSEYVFEVLNRAALAGFDEALAKGATAGRVSVVAVCYSFGPSDQGMQLLTPMGVFINTTDMDVTPEGKAVFRTRVKYIPPTDPPSASSPGADGPVIEGN